MAYDENDQPIKIPKNMLPVKLPEIEKLSSTGNPLDSENDSWKYFNLDGKKYTEEKPIHWILLLILLGISYDSVLLTIPIMALRKRRWIIGCQLTNILVGLNMPFYIYYILGFLCKHSLIKMMILN